MTQFSMSAGGRALSGSAAQTGAASCDDHQEVARCGIAADPAGFMAGVALFDELLGQAQRCAHCDDAAGMPIEARYRDGAPLSLYALPFIDRLKAGDVGVAQGFAAALGDYLGDIAGGLTPYEGPCYEHLSFDMVEVRHG